MYYATDRARIVEGVVALLVAMTMTVATVARGDDRVPPKFRGQAGSTFQHWNFPVGNPGGPAADALSNPYGTPVLTVYGEAEGGAVWSPDEWTLNDVGAGRLDFAINNSGEAGSGKLVYVQVTYAEGSTGAPLVRVLGASGQLAQLKRAPVLVDLGNGYMYQLSLWRLDSCPQSETVVISAAGGPGGGGTTRIDQVVIDTLCGDPDSCCDGDADGSGAVNFGDLLCIIQAVTLRDPAACPLGDVNCDGWLDGCDLDAAICELMQDPNCCGNCPGACCVGGDACTTATQAACEEASPMGLGGFYLGDGTDCAHANAVWIEEPGGGVFLHRIGPPVDCSAPGGGQRTAPCDSGPFYDPWESPAHGQMCHNFGVSGSPPIPADFFGPGSDPFTGTVCLQGVPLGLTAYGEFGDADTIIERARDPFDPATPVVLPAVSDLVEIEVVALSMESVSPITVTYNGGQTPESWNVTVDLSTSPPSPGYIAATKTHCNGGTYTSVMNVQPRFTFAEVGNPGNVAVLDTGAEAGFDPIALLQDLPAPWSHNVGDTLGLMGDPCSGFHAGVADAVIEFDSCSAPIPAVSTWGIFVMALLVMGAGSIMLRRARVETA